MIIRYHRRLKIVIERGYRLPKITGRNQRYGRKRTMFIDLFAFVVFITIATGHLDRLVFLFVEIKKRGERQKGLVCL